MAVDYMGYINRVQQNARAQQPDIAAALSQAIEQRRAGEAHDQRLKLSDLEMKQRQMEIDKMGRKAALDQRAQAAFQNSQPRTLSSLNPAYVSPEKFQEQATTGPPQMNQGQDYNLDYGFAANSQQPIYPAQGASPQEIASLQNLQPKELTTTQPADPYGDMARVYAEGGDFEGMQKVMTVQDILAKAKAKGDPVAYEKAKFSADNYDNFVKRITPLLKTAPGREQAESIAKAYQAMHPEDATMYDISNWEVTAAGVANPVADQQGKIIGHMVTDSEGKTSFHKADKGAETWGEPYAANIGGKRAMVQKSSTGQIKPVIQDTSTTVKVSTGGSKEKDLPAGIQDKISAKLEMYNDWSTLKDTFKPEFIPKTPFKSVNEFKIKMDKVFKGNQEAIDWWTRYFDSRNLLLKDRSGAAITEPEFVRFEQGSIAANTNPQTIINYLDRSVKKYGQHKDAYLTANEKNHPESVKAFRRAYGDEPKGKNAPAKVGKYTYTVE